MKLNLLKKILAFTLILLMAIPMMAIQGFAAALPDSATWASGKITASVESDESADLTVNAYQLVKVNTGAVAGTDPAKYQPQEYEYEWANAALGSLDAVKDYTEVVDGHYYLKDNIDPAYNTELTDTAIANIYSLVEKDLSSLGLTPIRMEKSGNAYVKTGLSMGVYLITATGGNYVYRPTVVEITPVANATDPLGWTIVSEVTTSIKGSPVSVDKKIVEGTDELTATSAAIGDTVSFKITADYPEFPLNAVAKKFLITDTMDEGLTYKENSMVVKQGDTTISVTPTVEGTKITVDLSSVSGLVATTGNTQGGKDNQIVITYQATLNEKAKVGTEGNKNKVKVTYSNDPYVTNSSKDTNEPEVTVYTYGIELTKVDKAAVTKTLADAEFKVKAGTEEMKFKAASDGTYVCDAAGTLTTLKTGSDGKITIKGLKEGTYSFTETKAPAGYVLPSQTTFDVTITDAKLANGQAGKNGAPEEGTSEYETGLVPLTVQNAKGFTLPTTGGIGTVMFTMIGIMLMGGGVLLIAVFLRKLRSKEV